MGSVNFNQPSVQLSGQQQIQTNQQGTTVSQNVMIGGSSYTVTIEIAHKGDKAASSKEIDNEMREALVKLDSLVQGFQLQGGFESLKIQDGRAEVDSQTLGNFQKKEFKPLKSANSEVKSEAKVTTDIYKSYSKVGLDHFRQELAGRLESRREAVSTSSEPATGTINVTQRTAQQDSEPPMSTRAPPQRFVSPEVAAEQRARAFPKAPSIPKPNASTIEPQFNPGPAMQAPPKLTLPGHEEDEPPMPTRLAPRLSAAPPPQEQVGAEEDDPPMPTRLAPRRFVSPEVADNQQAQAFPKASTIKPQFNPGPAMQAPPKLTLPGEKAINEEEDVQPTPTQEASKLSEPKPPVNERKAVGEIMSKMRQAPKRDPQWLLFSYQNNMRELRKLPTDKRQEVFMETAQMLVDINTHTKSLGVEKDPFVKSQIGKLKREAAKTKDPLIMHNVDMLLSQIQP